MVRERGQVSDIDIAELRDAGYSNGQIVEVVAVAAENVFTNLINIVAQTDIDFPRRQRCGSGLMANGRAGSPARPSFAAARTGASP